MKTIGIIAEYNPFHNGHAYQIKKIKEEMQADYVVVAMSGDFVQRGAPAIMDKYARAKMALLNGADLVLELPVLWATASAESFAMAGVTLFEKMGCVDGICFGAETDNLSLLQKLADVLCEEPAAYRVLLAGFLKEGMAFPAARSKALYEYLRNISPTSSLCADDFDVQDIVSILASPNNILAVEYLKALKIRRSSMVPYLLKREGAGYHEETILNTETLAADFDGDAFVSASASAPIASATAIRKLLTSKKFSFSASLTDAMPASALEVLASYLKGNALLHANDFSSVLGYRLLTTDTSTLADIGDSNPDLANRLYKNRMNFSSFEQFCELNKSRDITYTRISRVLLHLILNLTNADYEVGKELDYIPYLRMLGFRKDASELLKALKNCAKVPVIAKLADASEQLAPNAMQLLEKDIFCADFYEQICAAKSDRISSSEYIRNIVRI